MLIKGNKRKPVLAMLFIVLIQGTSCRQPNKPVASLPEKHMAQVKKQNGVMLYADRISNKAILRTDSVNTSTVFCSYKIGVLDSSLATLDKKQQLLWGKYFDFEMQKNWTALVNNDSIPAVFFQGLPQKSSYMREAVVVFEVPKGSNPDTLIYNNTYQTNNTDLLVLSNK